MSQQTSARGRQRKPVLADPAVDVPDVRSTKAKRKLKDNGTESNLKRELKLNSEVVGDVILCYCGVTIDDGKMMIQCDECATWIHTACIQLDADDLPDHFICRDCQPNFLQMSDIHCECSTAIFDTISASPEGPPMGVAVVQCQQCHDWFHVDCHPPRVGGKQYYKHYYCNNCPSDKKRSNNYRRK